MPQSLSFVLVHLIFSTKDRRPLLAEAVRPALYGYLATAVRHAGCECYCVGGIGDHIHLAVRLSGTTNIAELVEQIKSASSKWFKTQSPTLSKFASQRGYAAFSVSPTDMSALVEYIAGQEDHHRKRSFQNELRAFLKRYGVECDERYLWD